tara:strand:- start:44823 stop:45776 length:954 start_codon:yes stop_codon:yes gene_type:complete
MKNFLFFFNVKAKKLVIKTLVPFLICAFIFITPQTSTAVSGGRIGGGDFSTPSIQRSGGYRSNGVGNSYRGGGIGFPFFVPIFGFGGGGLFGFLFLIAISGIIVNTFRGVNYSPSQSTNSITSPKPSVNNVTMIQIELALLASAQELQEKLRNIAATADTANKVGLQSVLQETTLAILRTPELWAYANIETGKVPFNSAEKTFTRLSLTTRSKLDKETTSNYSGQIFNPNGSTISQVSGQSGQINEFIALTLLVATTTSLSINPIINNEQLQENLKAIGSIPANELIALEVIWEPDGKGESLNTEKLLTTFPNLKHL